MFVSVIIAAGGRGTRLGSDTPKQWLTVGSDTLLALCVRAFDAHPRVDEIIVVAPPGEDEREIPASRRPLKVTFGGARRQDSVANGFAAVAAHAFALHGIEDLVAAVVVDVELHRLARLPVPAARLAGLEARAFLVDRLGREGRIDGELVLRLRAGGARGGGAEGEEQGEEAFHRAPC